MDSAELLLHPVRLRIVHAFGGDQKLTTGALADLLPDISRATLYRQVGMLAKAGILSVADESVVKGLTERTYQLQPVAAVIDDAAAASATLEDHRRIFALAMSVLLAEYESYLDSAGADPIADQVGYRQHAIWLSTAEREQLIEDLRAVLVPRLRNAASGDRRRHLISPIMFPVVNPKG